ncbi:rhomboid family intramembrane serine protease [Xanthobacter sp.]|uniref:rhomboid family intramembrane serine protease n=1 Tax=Xanthobacter sp. TaxID=35809 RepID=UPI0025EE5B2B|nr:rhomboid family intramembrane serine protease [Xanthobacter sp.]
MHGQKQGFFEQPHAATYLLITVNIAIFGMMALRTGAAAPGGRDLWQAGALYPLVLLRGEYWRLVAHGFLHANPMHLFTNMLCLALWGGHLERRVGATYFLVIYTIALLAGGLASLATHHGPYLSVGASGAVSGVLGALFCLWILGKIELSASFFLINIGLNITLSLSTRGIDWGAHLGGFTAGLVACALIDLVERGNARVFACKFPEGLKLNVMMLAVVAPASVALFASSLPATPAAFALAAGIVLLAVVLFAKAIDLVLMRRHGLAIAAAMLALLNSAAMFAGLDRLAQPICATPGRAPAIAALCSHVGLLPTLGAAVMLALSLGLSARSIAKGVADVGFVAPSLRGERRRRLGL